MRHLCHLLSLLAAVQSVPQAAAPLPHARPLWTAPADWSWEEVYAGARALLANEASFSEVEAATSFLQVGAGRRRLSKEMPSAIEVPISDALDFEPYLRTVEDIKSMLKVDPDSKWHHVITRVLPDGSTKEVERDSLLDPWVITDPELYDNVVTKENEELGVSGAYRMLKSLIQQMQTARTDIGLLKLDGYVKTPDPGDPAKNTSTRVGDIEFIDRMIHEPQSLFVTVRDLVKREPPKMDEEEDVDIPIPGVQETEEGKMEAGGGGGGQKPQLPHGDNGKHMSEVNNFPHYLSRQRCEVCVSVIMRKLAQAPHLCAGMEFYHDTCNDVVVSILHWYPNVIYWAVTGGCDKIDETVHRRIKPCPPHAVCAWLNSPNYHIPFCPWDPKFKAPGLEDPVMGGGGPRIVKANAADVWSHPIDWVNQPSNNGINSVLLRQPELNQQMVEEGK